MLAKNPIKFTTSRLQTANGSVDIAVGGLTASPAQRLKVWSTFPHIFLNLKFFLPISPPYTPLEKIGLPFALAVWIWTFVTLLFIICCRIFNFGMPILDVISTMLGGGVVQEPSTFNPRFVLLIWLSVTLILRTVYHGVLFEILQLQVRGPRIDTLDKIVEYNYTFYASPVAYDMLYHGVPALRPQ